MTKNKGWHGEPRRHGLAQKGVKTVIDDHRRLAVNHFVSNGISEWTRFDIERNIFMANREMPIGTIIDINGIKYEIRNYFLNYSHNVPTVEIWSISTDNKKHRKVEFVPLSIIWKNYVNYSAISKENKRKEWDKLETYKHNIKL